MAAVMEPLSDTAECSARSMHFSGGQQDAILEKQRDDLERVLGLVPRHQRIAMLTRMVEADILPRLAAARRPAKAGPARGGIGKAAPPVVTTEADTVQLVRLLLKNETADSVAFIETLRQRGATPASLFLGIISDAARCLGTLWDEDRCHFAEVTISMGRLQQVVRALSRPFQDAALSRAHADSILLLPAPGEQHSFGLVILSEFFLREGWHVVGGPISSRNDAVDVVRTAWVDVVGFSIGSSARVAALTGCIRDVRAASVNTDIRVMVGGPLLLMQPGLAAELGADASATDAPSAVHEARGLLSARSAAR